VVHRCFRPLEDWRAVASEVQGEALPAGHYLPEEVPDATCERLVRFFA
jgi:haloacetate dehalogenase